MRGESQDVEVVETMGRVVTASTVQLTIRGTSSVCGDWSVNGPDCRRSCGRQAVLKLARWRAIWWKMRWCIVDVKKEGVVEVVETAGREVALSTVQSEARGTSSVQRRSSVNDPDCRSARGSETARAIVLRSNLAGFRWSRGFVGGRSLLIRWKKSVVVCRQ